MLILPAALAMALALTLSGLAASPAVAEPLYRGYQVARRVGDRWVTAKPGPDDFRLRAVDRIGNTGTWAEAAIDTRPSPEPTA